MPDYYKELLTSADTDIGILPLSAYDSVLPRPIAWLRTKLLNRLPAESRLLAQHQAWMRKRLGKGGDIFFVYTSLLGTHSFFLVFLPLTFWLGSQRNGRGLVAVTALGCWLASFMKDVLCLPRPYAPPMRRLALGKHHLEYGFPSTHTTNSVSMALYGFLLLWDRSQAALAPESHLPLVPSWVPVLVGITLALYATSVSYGRVYAGMHSLTDVIGGALFGALVIPVQRLGQAWLETQLVNPSWAVPTMLNMAFLTLVTVHPQPVEDCPCFEDAVAFVAVLAGVNCGRWYGYRLGWQVTDDNPLHMRVKMDLFVPRISVSLTARSNIVQRNVENALDLLARIVNPILGIPSLGAAQGWATRATILVPILIVLLGITQLVLVRLVVKSISRAILPPVFNAAQKATQGLAMLPRRHYTPAQEYGGKMPSRTLSPTPSILGDYEWRAPTPLPRSPVSSLGLSSFPGSHRASPSPLREPPFAPSASAFALQSSLREEPQEGIQRPASTPNAPTEERLRRRPDRTMANSSSATSLPAVEESSIDEQALQDFKPKPRVIVHYDVDVLIKFITYFAIGFHGSTFVPALFQRVGWSPLP